MSDCTLTKNESKSFNDLQVKAAKLRIKKISSENEFIELSTRDLSEEDCAAAEKKRRKIIFDLELEGAEIELEYIEKYRSRVLGLAEFPSGGEFKIWGKCIVCEKCVTSSCLSCVACASCIGISSL